jgi:hypothetical protein
MIPLRRPISPQHRESPGDDRSVGLCLTLDDARAVLEHWHGRAVQLRFSYFRAGGGLIQSGRAVVRRIGPRSITLETGDSRLAVTLTQACVEFRPVELFRPAELLKLGEFLRPEELARAGLAGTVQVEGLSISLENQDWLFLFADGHD